MFLRVLEGVTVNPCVQFTMFDQKFVSSSSTPPAPDLHQSFYQLSLNII